MHVLREHLSSNSAAVPRNWFTGADRVVPDTTVLDLFDHRVAIAPDAIAGRSGTRCLSYHDLDEAAAAGASLLIDRGVEPGSRVGVLVERSVDLLIGLLAVWKAGCVYTPLDLDHPVERIGYVLADAHAPAVLTQRSLADRMSASRAAIVALEDRSERTHPAPLSVRIL